MIPKAKKLSLMHGLVPSADLYPDLVQNCINPFKKLVNFILENYMI